MGQREFDLLERLCDRIDALAGRPAGQAGGSSDLRACFARGTGGLEIGWLAEMLAQSYVRAPVGLAEIDTSQGDHGARYGVPIQNGNAGVSPCGAWFTALDDALAYQAAIRNVEVWDLQTGERVK